MGLFLSCGGTPWCSSLVEMGMLRKSTTLSRLMREGEISLERLQWKSVASPVKG